MSEAGNGLDNNMCNKDSFTVLFLTKPDGITICLNRLIEGFD